MRTKPEMLLLVGEVAVAGLNHVAPSLEDQADVYEGLAEFLPKQEAEAAKYAATCIRESRRAQEAFLARLESRKAGA
jgi:hypothetical protein